MVTQTSIVCPHLIGRASQLESLAQLIHETQDHKSQVALISGEAGIGKSRLRAETKTIAQQMGFSILEGYCFESDHAVPYAPLVHLLRIFCAARSSDDISRYLGPDASELSRLLPELNQLLPDSIPVTVSAEPEQAKRRLFEAVVQFFFRVAASTPLLITIEDLHWTDDNTLEFLLYFVRRITSQSIALFITLRSEATQPRLSHFLNTLIRERQPLEIVLTPLEIGEVDEMIRKVSGLTRPVRKEFLKTMYRLTEGNPLFIEEILKSLGGTGALHTHGNWDRNSMERLRIPSTLQDLVQQRMEQLDEKARQTLTIAAVIGQRFDFALLQELTGRDEQELTQILKVLITAQLVTEDSAQQFSFRHALVREAVYASLLQREQQRYHRVIAETLERMSTQTLARGVTDLAYHFYRGALWDKALQYSQLAGQRAQSLYAPTEAVEYFTQALHSTHEMDMTPPALLYRERGQAYEMLGDFENARMDYEQALKSARQASNGVAEWQSLIDLGFLLAGRDYRLAGSYFRDALAHAEQMNDAVLRAFSLNRLGNWLTNTGHFEEGLRSHQEALKILEEHGNMHGMAETFDLLGIAYGMYGDKIKAVEQLDQAITLFSTLDDKQGLLSSLSMRALQSMPSASETTLCPMRKKDECVQDASKALLLASQMDSLTAQAFTENALAHTLLSFGEVGPALLHAREAERIATEIGHQQWMAATHHCLGRIYLSLLQPAPAEKALAYGLKLAQELGSAFWATTLAANLGLAYILKQDLPAAEATLQAAMPYEQHPRNTVEREIALAWGELLLAQQKPQLALQITEQLMASVPGRGPEHPAQPIPHLLRLKGEALMALSQLNEAVVALEEARQGAHARGALPILWKIHRSLGQAYQFLRRKDQARQEWDRARQTIAKLALTIEDVSLRDAFERAALGSLRKEKPLRPRESAKQAYGGLTVREREIAALVAQGKTSREIANLLVVSERTAEAHVTNILRKLGFTSRSQIAAWAVEIGLATH